MIKKAEVSVQTFFFIMMVILMVAIIAYGLNKFIFVEEVISKQELTDLENELKDAFEYCEDPLNRGSFKTIEINNNDINGVCVNNLSGSSYASNLELSNEFNTILNTGDNLILLSEQNIENSFSVDYDRSFCVEKDKNLKIKITC